MRLIVTTKNYRVLIGFHVTAITSESGF
ncbi:uncharacterized protein METZ01_LOCUS91778 [marine metagenome]|uniref:Uncharacterized protein n=1 Tax=marine metagenome TaxID=408172 RepID=A0A381VFE9_9ZZZZ